MAAPSDRPQQPVRAGLQDLPLVEVLADPPEKDVMAIVLSGDGGWAGIDREIAGVLGKKWDPRGRIKFFEIFLEKEKPGDRGRRPWTYFEGLYGCLENE